MKAIICANDAKTVVEKMQEYLQENTNISGIQLVETDQDQIVILVGQEPLDKTHANTWWSGYKAAMESIL